VFYPGKLRRRFGYQPVRIASRRTVFSMRQSVKSIPLWLLALAITLVSAYYQRQTGPTHPLCGNATVGKETFAYCLPRSYAGEGDATVAIAVKDTTTFGEVSYRRSKSLDLWTTVPMSRHDDHLTAMLPHQPPAGKVMYRVTFTAPGARPVTLTNDPVIIRFKGSVPLAFLVPHIILMFAAMLLSTRTGLEALARGPAVPAMALWTVILLFLGGLILGPIVQKYVFGSFWTGWPFGGDLTDNKTIVAFIGWLIAAVRVRQRRDRYVGAIVASLLLLAVYLIPHSVLGSEIDYTTLPHGTNGTP